MSGALIRTLTRRVSPAGARGRLSVLIFHSVLAQADSLRPGEPTAEEFERILRWLTTQFNVIRLSDAIEHLQQGTLPERAAAVTFDDGYANNHDVALPILQKLGAPATFFIATGYLDGGIMFNDAVIECVRHAGGAELDLSALGLGTHLIRTDEGKRTAIGRILQQVKYLPVDARAERVASLVDITGTVLPKNLMMSSEQVKGMHRNGMDIGGHTVSHPILASLDDAQARSEIAAGRAQLEALTGERVELFAYPNGQPMSDYGQQHVHAVRELGFSGAVSTASGVTSRGDDLYQIRRFTPWDRRGWRFGARMLRNLTMPPQSLAGLA